MVGAVSRSQFRQQLLRLNTTNILKVSLQLKTPALARLALVRKILDSSVTEHSRDVESNGYSDALSEDKGAADLHTPPHDLEVDEDVALLQNFERCLESVQEYSFGDLTLCLLYLAAVECRSALVPLADRIIELIGSRLLTPNLNFGMSMALRLMVLRVDICWLTLLPAVNSSADSQIM